MSWSISKSGKKEEVASQLRAQTFQLSDANEQAEAEAIRDAAAVVAEKSGPSQISVSASGSKDGLISVSISRWNDQA